MKVKTFECYSANELQLAMSHFIEIYVKEVVSVSHHHLFKEAAPTEYQNQFTCILIYK